VNNCQEWQWSLYSSRGSCVASPLLADYQLFMKHDLTDLTDAYNTGKSHLDLRKGFCFTCIQTSRIQGGNPGSHETCCVLCSAVLQRDWSKINILQCSSCVSVVCFKACRVRPKVLLIALRAQPLAVWPDTSPCCDVLNSRRLIILSNNDFNYRSLLFDL
jgi:hypothetical protein